MKSSDLAALIGTSSGFLSQAMTPLVARGWVTSDPGRSGGYAISIAPSDVSALDIIEAVEGPTDNGNCVLAGEPCNPLEPCALHVPWSTARSLLLAELGATSLEMLANKEAT